LKLFVQPPSLDCLHSEYGGLHVNRERAALKSSAQQGCALCKILWDDIISIQEAKHHGTKEIKFKITGNNLWDDKKRRDHDFWVINFSHEGGRSCFTVYAPPGKSKTERYCRDAGRAELSIDRESDSEIY
jgi:hypothetical protein